VYAYAVVVVILIIKQKAEEKKRKNNDQSIKITDKEKKNYGQLPFVTLLSR